MAARGARAAAGDAGDRVLDPRSPDTTADRLRGFRQGLKDIGFVEGENVAIDYRWAEGQIDRLPALAAELVRRQVAVIAATEHCVGTCSEGGNHDDSDRLRRSDDPVGLGLVASLARPGGNATVSISFRKSWCQSGWSSCASWCPAPLVWPCSSTRPPLRRPKPR